MEDCACGNTAAMRWEFYTWNISILLVDYTNHQVGKDSEIIADGFYGPLHCYFHKHHCAKTSIMKLCCRGWRPTVVYLVGMGLKGGTHNGCEMGWDLWGWLGLGHNSVPSQLSNINIEVKTTNEYIREHSSPATLCNHSKHCNYMLPIYRLLYLLKFPNVPQNLGIFITSSKYLRCKLRPNSCS